MFLRGNGGTQMMPELMTSRLAGFHKLPVAERLAKVSRMLRLTAEESAHLDGTDGLPIETANQMIENAVGVFHLPLGLGLNMTVNNRDYIVPMAVEEPSVVAAVSFAA